MRYRVTAAYVTAETAVDGGRAEVDIPRGALLPDDVLSEQRDRFIAAGEIDPEREPAPVKPVDEDPATVPYGPIDEVLGWVGDDRDRAAAALEVEQSKGDGARSTLVAKLAALAATE